MKKIIIPALLLTISTAHANNPCSFNISKRHIPLIAAAIVYEKIIEAPARAIKKAFINTKDAVSPILQEIQEDTIDVGCQFRDTFK